MVLASVNHQRPATFPKSGFRCWGWTAKDKSKPRFLGYFSKVFGAVLALALVIPGAAQAVPHDGVIFDGRSPGARFYFLHPASNSSSGGSPAVSIPNGGISSADIAYSWNPVGDPFVPGSAQVFDRGATVVWDCGALISGTVETFTLSLWENVAGATNTITAGAFVGGTTHRDSGPAETVSNLHRATGDFGFTITDNSSGSVLSDIFFFGDMRPNASASATSPAISKRSCGARPRRRTAAAAPATARISIPLSTTPMRGSPSTSPIAATPLRSRVRWRFSASV